MGKWGNTFVIHIKDNIYKVLIIEYRIVMNEQFQNSRNLKRSGTWQMATIFAIYFQYALHFFSQVRRDYT